MNTPIKTTGSVITMLILGAVCLIACRTSPPRPVGAAREVVRDKELFIRNPAISQSAMAERRPAWHIRSALQRIAGPGQDVDEFAEAWFKLWETPGKIPGSEEDIQPRATVASALRSAWQNDRFKLIAIVGRMDLARFPDSDTSKPPTSLGEARFIYELVGAQGQSLPMTIIFEYSLPTHGRDPKIALKEWAMRWRALGAPELGGPGEFGPVYMEALQKITDDFSSRATLNQIRSNELLQGSPVWELREFHLSEQENRLLSFPVVLTSAIGTDNTTALGQLIQRKEVDLINGEPINLPPQLQGAVATVPGRDFHWKAPGTSPRSEFIYSFNTCNGCHAGATGTFFQHVGVLSPAMSPFLTGEISLAQALPPAVNQNRKHDEMSERARILAAFAGEVPQVRIAVTEPSLPELIKARVNRPH